MKQNLIQIRSNQVHAPSEIIKNIAIPDDENKFEIDMSGSSVGWLGDKGNIVLKGSCFVLESCVNGAVDNSLIILNSSDDYLAYINESGDMCISSGDCLDNHADCSNPTDSLAIKNSSDDVISYLNGSVCLTGKLYESIENLDSGETNDSLIYDSNGNLISDGDYDYTYNEFNQLSSVSDGNGVIAEYYYNAEGSRIKKLENNETTYYIGDSFVQVRNDSGVFNEIYYYDNDKLIASNISGEISYYHPDHLGSTTLITNESGDVIEETFYLPFGEIISGGDARYDYTGKELDNVGLMYYGARYYSSEMMKFTQADLVISEIYNPQDLNHYSYVRNNPYKYVDRGGRWALQINMGSSFAVLNTILGYSGGIALAYDPNTGKIQIGGVSSKEKGLGVGTGISAGPSVSFDKSATKISDLKGEVKSLGGTLAVEGIGATIDISKGGFSIGYSLGLEAEVHWQEATIQTSKSIEFSPKETLYKSKAMMETSVTQGIERITETTKRVTQKVKDKIKKIKFG